MTALLPALLVALAVLVWGRPPGAARLARVLPHERPTRERPPHEPRPRERSSRESGTRAPVKSLVGPTSACALAGLAAALLVGGALGLVLGAAAAVAGPRLLSGLEPAADRATRELLEAGLPGALDLLAACLGGGASVPAAVQAVAGAAPGPVGERFAKVAAALDLGAPPAEAWQRLAAGHPDGLAASAARALTRAAEGGAPVAEVVGRLAARARADARGRQEQAAARAGVQAVAPLGLCFLPAFVLLGIVPVVVGLVGPVLRGL